MLLSGIWRRVPGEGRDPCTGSSDLHKSRSGEKGQKGDRRAWLPSEQRRGRSAQEWVSVVLNHLHIPAGLAKGRGSAVCGEAFDGRRETQAVLGGRCSTKQGRHPQSF